MERVLVLSEIGLLSGGLSAQKNGFKSWNYGFTTFPKIWINSGARSITICVYTIWGNFWLAKIKINRNIIKHENWKYKWIMMTENSKAQTQSLKPSLICSLEQYHLQHWALDHSSKLGCLCFTIWHKKHFKTIFWNTHICV